MKTQRRGCVNQLRRVGVVTLPGDFNYGNKLQLYATMAIWRSIGYDPVYLSYRRKMSKLEHPKDYFRRIIGHNTQAITFEQLRSPERAAAFVRFGELVPSVELSAISNVDASDYVYLSVGSDQVWNPTYTWTGCAMEGWRRTWHSMLDHTERKDSLDWFFLRFADPTQRIALAPSIGLETLNKEESSWLAEGLKSFGRLSVREQRGAWLIRHCSGKDASVICDPTLVLSRDQWAHVMDNRCTPDSPYVFTYLLGAESRESRDAINHATNGGDIPIISLSDKSQPGEPDAGPAEFISLVSHATHVVTDSFHASVFAAIFERPLTIVRRSGYGQRGMFSRLESLTNILGIQNKVILPGKRYDSSAHSDYEGVVNAIADQRDTFMGYLRDCINS